MKIVIALNTSWNIYNYRKELVSVLIGMGHELHTVAPPDEYTSSIISMGCVHHPIAINSHNTNPFGGIKLILSFWLLYRKIRPDLVLNFTVKPNIFSALAAAMLRIRCINNVCGLGTLFLKKNLLTHIAVFLYRLSFRFAHHVFFQNPDDLDYFLKGRIVKRNITSLLPGSGINLSKFKPPRFQPRNDQFIFLMVSRLIVEKGINEFISAAKKLKSENISAKFQVLGSKETGHKHGVNSEVLSTYVKAGLIEYLGTTDDVAKFLQSADCVVLPSYREGTPKSLLEAASVGKPIITTDVPGCNQVVKDGHNGLLCKARDAADLAKKMLAIANMSAAELERLGRNGRLKMEREFNVDFVVNKYVDLIEQLHT